MIRRFFWMIVGALLGVTGYRRVSRLARAVTLGGRRGAGPRGLDRTRSAALFARDVREGMELYMDRHPGLTDRTLEGQEARTQRSRRAGAGAAGQDRVSIDYAKDGR